MIQNIKIQNAEKWMDEKMDGIVLNNISIVLNDKTSRNKNANKKERILLRSFNLTIGKNQLLAIKGPSGCGKSTLLSLLAGTIDYRVFSVQGQLQLFSQNANRFTIAQRRVGLLTQDHLLFPHFTVEQNLAFVMPRNISPAERKNEIVGAVERAGLSHTLTQNSLSLSGGERARIAMLAVLLRKPKYVLLDEPFSKLDDERRVVFREFVFDVLAAMGLPVVMVTHDASDVASFVSRAAKARKDNAWQEVLLQKNAEGTLKTMEDRHTCSSLEVRQAQWKGDATVEVHSL